MATGDRTWNWIVENYGPLAIWASISTVLLSVVCWAIAERLYAARPHRPRLAGYNLLLMLAFLTVDPVIAAAGGATSNLLLRALDAPLLPLDLLALSEVGPPWLRRAVLLPLALIPTVLFDFFYYWLHYAQHKIPWLWEFHKLHHTDAALNVTTVHRDHWMEPLFNAMFIFAPMAILVDLSPVESGLVTLVMSQWSYFVHANLRLRLGWATLLITGPQYHRIHHSIELQHRDKNLAAFFPIWDVLFGTCHRPGENEWPATGVEGEALLPGLLEASFGPFFANARALRRRMLARA